MSPASRCLSAAAALTLTGVLSSCALLPFGRKQPAPVKLPDTRGWGLMMDPSLTGQASVAAQGSPTGAPSADGGTPSATTGGLYDFSSVTGNAGSVTSRVPWMKSAMDATELARRSGKPLLILVNNRNSPSGQSIESTLVLQPEFKKLAEETYIPLRMDFADEDTTKSDFYQAFKDRLKVRGYPALLVMLPDGTEVLRLSGYKHEYEVPYMLKLRESVASCKKAVDARRKKLEPAGYRGWTDKKGVLVFAKLEKADANMLHLTTEWGTKFTTFTNRLSDADQEWVAERQRAAAGGRATASASL